MTRNAVSDDGRCGPRMSLVDFDAWYRDRPSDERWELDDGVAVAMAPETLDHARVKYRTHKALDAAIQTAGLACELLPDGVGLAIDDRNGFEPDAVVTCGPPEDGDRRYVENPVIVVEVLSASTQSKDMVLKLRRYFEHPRVRHYLIVSPRERAVIHHRRLADGSIVTEARFDGTLTLDPPGLAVPLDALFPPPTAPTGAQPESPA